jgi:hypothetical protein
MKEKILNIARIVVLSFILSTAIGYSLADWAPPSGSPPNYNTPPPINVGPASQRRDGNLFLNNWLVAKKAETQSTAAGDSGTTLTTKDYVDGRIPPGMTFAQSTGCGSCPYGSFNTGGGYVCYLKTQTGSLVVAPGTTGYCAGTTGSPALGSSFWTY